MPPADLDDTWSDDDEELETDFETAVQLGIPDGLLDSSTDLIDPTVSRIGGHPTFLSPPHPPLTYAICNNCANPMELLAQIWCPLEESPNDRALFVWGCANGSCQRKEGSVRAWRELRFNNTYAKKLAQKQARRKEKEALQAKVATDAALKNVQPKGNPFALGATSAPNPFGLGSQIFGDGSVPDISSEANRTDFTPTEAARCNGSPDSDSSETDSAGEGDGNEDEDEDELTAAVNAVSVEDSPWKASPAYTPFYLSTESEYLPPPPKIKVPAGATVDPDDPKSAKDKDGSLSGWAMEGYENSMDVDHAFERFSKRVSHEGEQCLRYELGGTPLPFSSDKVFDKLFPIPPAPPLPITKPDFMVIPPRKRTYAPESLPVCPHCKSRRVFECQLMPNLINVLKPDQSDRKPGQGKKAQTDKERCAEVLRTLKGQDGAGRRGMEWGTCMVFSCEKDCAAGGEAVSTWREEFVLVQWDE